MPGFGAFSGTNGYWLAPDADYWDCCGHALAQHTPAQLRRYRSWQWKPGGLRLLTRRITGPATYMCAMFRWETYKAKPCDRYKI